MGELAKKTGLSEKAVKNIFHAASKFVCTTPPCSVLDIINGKADSSRQFWRLPTYLSLIDKHLHGGLIYPGVTEICGESGSGKTQFSIHMCLSAQVEAGDNSVGALYICTEDAFPTKRLYQMADEFNKKYFQGPKKHFSHLTDRLYIEHCVDLEDLWSLLDVRIHGLVSKVNLKIIVIDSIAALFRAEYDLNETQERAKVLAKFGRLLLDLSSKYKLCVLCINQVTDLMGQTETSKDGSRAVVPALGLAWSHHISTRIMLSRTHWNTSMFTTDDAHQPPLCDVVVRSLQVVYSPYLPCTKTYFLVDASGIKDFQF